MNYSDKLRENQEYLTVIAAAYRQILKASMTKKNKKVLEKQQNIFYKILKVKHQYNKFQKKTRSNLKNNTDLMGYGIIIQVKKELQMSGYKQELISKVLSKNRNDSLNDVLDTLAAEYNNTLKNISLYESSVEGEKLNESEVEKSSGLNKEKPLVHSFSPEEIEKKTIQEKLDDYDRNISENAEYIINGPKKKGVLDILTGRDINAQYIEYLYGLSFDLLILMNSDQKVSVKKANEKSFISTSNCYFGFNSDFEYRKEQLLKKYGARTIEQLLDKYEKIRELYFKKYSKLNEDKKEAYAIENQAIISSSFDCGQLERVLKSKKLKFPPSKDVLISVMNARIMNGENYRLARPNAQEGHNVSEPFDIKEYYDVLDYYKNLTKNMSIKEISMLYRSVCRDMESLEKNSIQYYAIMQKIFCELIFLKKELKFVDTKQQDEQFLVIAKEYLDEDLKYSIEEYDVRDKETTEKRKDTIYKMYLKYYAEQKDKKKALKFSEYAERYCGLKYLDEPENLKLDLKGLGK